MSKKNKPTEAVLHVDSLPPKLKRDFKAACARREIPMRDVVIDFLRSYVAKNK